MAGRLAQAGAHQTDTHQAPLTIDVLAHQARLVHQVRGAVAIHQAPLVPPTVYPTHLRRTDGEAVMVPLGLRPTRPRMWRFQDSQTSWPSILARRMLEPMQILLKQVEPGMMLVLSTNTKKNAVITLEPLHDAHIGRALWVVVPGQALSGGSARRRSAENDLVHPKHLVTVLNVRLELRLMTMMVPTPRHPRMLE